ncbi:hypothetical protein K431DRAFT_153449 [Polychaeton citri CBS 116435]|uniref:Uncharacterized protein n=1 Tax=Polychaeton citri CBS 116435 TaxID=1314669 RepID=A0A9P4Q0X4_9PEZI|nr:hypothetical protein K431DRAFT_153449 [Polychaeton citri CBS 116435]
MVSSLMSNTLPLAPLIRTMCHLIAVLVPEVCLLMRTRPNQAKKTTPSRPSKPMHRPKHLFESFLVSCIAQGRYHQSTNLFPHFGRCCACQEGLREQSRISILAPI